MTEQEIIQLHKELYDYLMGIHEKDTSFRFRVRRMNNQNRLDKGYWFNGNNDYLETSFWDYKDNLHQTSVIRLVYYFETKKWACELIGRDSQARKVYFENMAKEFGGFVNENEKMPIWKKELSNQLDFLTTLHYFIKKDRKEIDTYLNDDKNRNEELINFIKEKDFIKDTKNIEKEYSKKELVAPNEKIKFLVDDYKIFQQGETLKSEFPYFFSSLYIKKFQGINELSIDIDAMNNVQWLFLTGENGFGKTSILRGIALGLVGDEINILQNGTEILVKGFSGNKTFTNNIKPKEALNNHFKLAAYGVSRFDKSDNSDDAKLNSLFERSSKLRNIESSLISAFHEEKEEKNAGRTETTFSNLIKIFEKVIPKLKIEVKRFDNEEIDKRWQVRYYEKDEAGAVFKDEKGKDISIELSDLAMGFRSIFMMIGDMVMRLSNNFRDSIKDISGVVLIDEFDAHLHPKYQYELPKVLSKAFPKVQFIVSTHSPIPLLGLPKDVNSVVFKVNRTASEGITVDRKDDDFDIHRLNPNALLSSSIFGFSRIISSDEDKEEDEPLPVNNITDVEHLQSIRETLEKLKKEGKI